MDNRTITTAEQNEAINFWRNALLLNTAIPAIVDSFDGKQKLSAMPAIRAKYVNPDTGAVTYYNYPKITNIPLSLNWSPTYGGLTYPIKQGDICTLIFSQRSLDNFMLSGRVSNPYDPEGMQYTELRICDLSDAMAFPGILTNNIPISSYNNEAVELRNANGQSVITVSNNALTLKCGASKIELTENGIEINGTQFNMTSQQVQIDTPITTFNSAIMNINGVLNNNSINVTAHTHISAIPGQPTGGMQ